MFDTNAHIKLKKKAIVIYPLKQNALNLEEMISRITKQNRYYEELVDKKRGREIW
ncbi:MAG: toxin-antitoxin system, antitoxin component, AbrB family protein [bacterium]|nr:toxin-antitoxin system, antitoxin component, AbrB family protein [bacterium]